MIFLKSDQPYSRGKKRKLMGEENEIGKGPGAPLHGNQYVPVRGKKRYFTVKVSNKWRKNRYIVLLDMINHPE